MRNVFSARKLEQEVDAMISAALKVGRGGQIATNVNGRERIFSVDRIVSDQTGFPSEIWFSADSPSSFFSRFFDSMRRVRRRDLMRVLREGGDVRRTVTTVELHQDGVTHIGFREEIGAPRISKSVAAFSYPRNDASNWLYTYQKAG